MTSAVSEITVDVEPVFVPTPNGDLFLLNYRARDHRPGRYLLIAPPFAEEMNKCRRMMALLARRVAALGYGALIVDLSGTGDSWGDFSDATYATWLEDLATAQSWLAERDAAVTALLGIRFGALLAADFVRNCPTCKHLLLWQPALNGKTVMAQFLRLRIAADMMSSEGAALSVAGLTAELQNNRSIEVAGYEITPQLFSAISALKLSELLEEDGPAVNWFHLSMLTNNSMPPADQRIIDTLTQRGLSVESTSMSGESFWNTTEITVCEPLIESTLQKIKAQ